MIKKNRKIYLIKNKFRRKIKLRKNHHLYDNFIPIGY